MSEKEKENPVEGNGETPEEETPEIPLEQVKDTIEKIRDEIGEVRNLYEEIIKNLPEEEGEETPSFEEWLKALHEILEEEKRRRKKYPRYPWLYYPPYYPYYPYYPKPRREEEEEEEEEEESPEGVGVVSGETDEHQKAIEKVVEALQNPKIIREQWEPTVVDVTTKELTGHLRDICMLSQVIRGKPGDVVNIPFVKDFDFDVLATVGGAFTEKTGLVGSVSTTLKEAGMYTTISYADAEKLGVDIIAELEEKMRTAALRAEDQVILDALMADADVPELDKSGSTSFDADFVAEAIGVMQSQQKEVQPGDCVLVLGPSFYEDLLRDIMGAMALVFARPDVIQKGRLAEFLGVEIRVCGYLPEWDTVNKYVSAYLIKRKSAVAFAPKRDLLVETEKLTKDRKIQLTASHTFGVVVIDDKAAVEIKVGAGL